MSRPLCIVVMFSLLAVGCSRDRAEEGPSLPRWSHTERGFTSLAYNTENADDAARILSFLVRELEIEAKRPNPEYGIEDAIWVNRLRLAGATYATGEKDRAFELMDQSVNERLIPITNCK